MIWRALGVALAITTGTGAALAADPAASTKAAPSTSATAAPAAAPAAAKDIDDAARSLFLEGVAAYERGEYDKAYALLLGAWKVKPHWQIAASLGAAELELGKTGEAAVHAAFYAREAPPDRKETANKLLADAKAKAGMILVVVDVPDAEILIDGVVTTAKAGELIYVDGDTRHKVAARKDGVTSEADVVASAGRTHEVRLTLREQAPQRSWPVIGVGAGLTVLAAGVGAGLTVAAKDAEDEMRRKGMTVTSPCPKSATSGTCKEIADAARRHDALADGAIGLFVAAGVFGAATAVYGIWPEILPVRPAVAAGPTGAALSFTGSF